MIISSKKNKKKSQAINLPVEVTGFTKKEQKGVGVEGISLLTGDKVTVFLTDRGKTAENKNRMSIEKLQKGYKIGRDLHQLVPGGQVSFRNAFPLGDAKQKIFLSTWPNVMAYNKQDAEQYIGHTNVGSLRFFEKSITNDNGEKSVTASGTLYVFEKDDKFHIKGKGLNSELREKFNAVVDKLDISRPGFLIRKLDENNQVEDCVMMNYSYNKEAGRPKTTSELLSSIYHEIKERWSDTKNEDFSYNIVPLERYTVSVKALATDAQGNNKINKFKSLAQSFLKEDESGEVELFAKEIYFKKGGDENQFVNDIYPVKPYDTGTDPALIGGLSYSNSEQEQNTDKEVMQENQESFVSKNQEKKEDKPVSPSPPQKDEELAAFEDMENVSSGMSL